MIGIISKINREKNFGFISADELEKDLFFHSDTLIGVEFDELREGDSVSFEIEESDKKINARNVQRG